MKVWQCYHRTYLVDVRHGEENRAQHHQSQQGHGGGVLLALGGDDLRNAGQSTEPGEYEGSQTHGVCSLGGALAQVEAVAQEEEQQARNRVHEPHPGQRCQVYAILRVPHNT
jgi:hypothetical protein